MSNFRTTRTSGVERIPETFLSSHRSESSHDTARARQQLLKAAGPSPGGYAVLAAGAGSALVYALAV